MIAAPVQPPTIAVSDSGASITRHGPELLLEALGDLEGAAVDADVLADHEHAPVALHLLPEPSEIAWRYVSSAMGSLVVRRVELFGGRVDARR